MNTGLPSTPSGPKTQANQNINTKKGTHGVNGIAFRKLSYADQARSLNAQIQILNKALHVHINSGVSARKNITTMRQKYIKQLSDIITYL